MPDKPKPELMACGCAPNAVDRNGDWVCVIHHDIPQGRTPVKAPSLEGRKAKCCYCKKTVPSHVGLAFFESKPLQATDAFYCGCRGWD